MKEKEREREREREAGGGVGGRAAVVVGGTGCRPWSSGARDRVRENEMVEEKEDGIERARKWYVVLLRASARWISANFERALTREKCQSE